MKKKQLKINQLQVKSFVTSFENKEENTIKAGAVASDFCGPSFDPCATFDYACPTLPAVQTTCRPCGGGGASRGCTQGITCAPLTTPDNCIQ